MSTSDESVAPAHGGPNQTELLSAGLSYADVLDFSVSTNPYGPAPSMIEAIRNAAIALYPEPTAAPARQAIADWLDVSERGVVVGNGASDLLWATARAFLRPGSAVVVAEPTFSEFRSACRAAGANVHEWRARAEAGFAFDLAAIDALVQQSNARLVFLTTPNTPTGTSLSIHDVSRWAQRNPETLVVVDQSFLSLSEDASERDTPLPGNVLLVRSLTKDHAVPGVRAGYVVTTPKRAALIERQRPAWSTSALAQAVAIEAPRLDAFVAECREKLLTDRQDLARELSMLGIDAVPSRTCFLMAPVDDATGVRTKLLTDHRILVRDCTSFGVPGYLRFGARPTADRARLIEALGTIRE